jgi:quercetin dioxygenase-like cupin family protein
MALLAAVSDEWPSAIVRVVRKVRLEMRGMLRSRRENAVAKGELPASTDIDGLSRFYLSVLQGMAIQARDNANYTLGPVMLHVGMNPGAVIPAHLHEGMAEALYVVEGDFTNEGKQYQAGTSLHFKAGKAHGPHSTKNGCKLLVLWTERTSKEAADLSDFTLATQKAA